MNYNLNDEDIVSEMLITEKNISNNYSIALNEMSNDYLYKEILLILTKTKNITRELYNLAYEKGWYNLSNENETKIEKAKTDAENKLNELS